VNRFKHIFVAIYILRALSVCNICLVLCDQQRSRPEEAREL